LWVGITFAEELGKKWNIPVIGANHMEGHITSVLFGDTKIKFPALALLISGGHTELVFLKNWNEKEKIGETQDDAVGEAFDKVARMLGLPYPGGPEISRLASQARESGIANQEFRFPRPMIHSKDFNFSFSGLKTAVLYYIKKIGTLGEKEKMEIAREFEDAVTETLISKTKRAIDEYSPKTLIIGGGVIANKALRENLLKLKENYQEMEVLIPEKFLTTDNATMIAAAGFIEYLRNGKREGKLKAQGNLDII
ncbi:MAG: tRNA (adenosine(37)-N6)-threonylcarbamoyltransferase complex transferase subunit TsaD, partial [Candidatus Zambryskibacteria bacterium]